MHCWLAKRASDVFSQFTRILRSFLESSAIFGAFWRVESFQVLSVPPPVPAGPLPAWLPVPAGSGFSPVLAALGSGLAWFGGGFAVVSLWFGCGLGHIELARGGSPLRCRGGSPPFSAPS
jgi:hypothetical protein